MILPRLPVVPCEDHEFFEEVQNFCKMFSDIDVFKAPIPRSTSINIGLHGFHDIPWMASRFEGNGKLWTLVFDVVTWVQDMAAWQPGPLWDELTWDGPIISGQGTLPALPKTLSRSHGPRSGYHGLHINLIKAQYSTHRGRY